MGLQWHPLSYPIRMNGGLSSALGYLSSSES